MNTYTIRRHLLRFHDRPHDPDRLLFHVRTGDYFATLATLLTLIQDLSPLDEHARNTLDRAREDLLYLQSTHAIVPKFDTENLK